MDCGYKSLAIKDVQHVKYKTTEYIIHIDRSDNGAQCVNSIHKFSNRFFYILPFRFWLRHSMCFPFFTAWHDILYDDDERKSLDLNY